MHNKEIIRILNLTASLLELYGENQFKVRSYQTAVYNLERTGLELDRLDRNALAELPGVGKSIAATIDEINHTGNSGTLDNLLKQTPPGIVELLKVKGIAARRIKTAWDHLGIENADQLYAAALKGQLAELPGFGAKTQDRIEKILEYHLLSQGMIHYKDAHLQGLQLEELIFQQFPEARLSRTGDFRRKLEVVKGLEYLWALENFQVAEEFLNNTGEFIRDPHLSGPFRWRGEIAERSRKLDIRFCNPGQFGNKLVYYTGNEQHLLLKNENGTQLQELVDRSFEDEKAVYEALGWPLIIPELREGCHELEFVKSDHQWQVLQPEDLKGILHCHSTYSDGKNSLEEMALACKALGYEYFGISDHSQTAVYANGLDTDRILLQRDEIERLNQELVPFKIFRGIESDILNDGSLDYSEEVLKTFDFIVASVHSNINMDIEQATGRLIRAIENPHTTILGHPTGRQLLKREGYPIYHEKVIDACARNNVIIEINAHPWRLDLDWRWVRQAMEKGVLISINPDAHEIAGLKDVLYGVNVARKAGLTPEMTFNALGADQIEQHFKRRKGEAAKSR